MVWLLPKQTTNNYQPTGWWHLVLNLEESLAITQNFVSEVRTWGVRTG